MPPRTRLATAAYRGLLTGQILFSLAFVGSCELPNWISGPLETNACLDRWMTLSALFFPSGVKADTGVVEQAMAAGRRGSSDGPSLQSLMPSLQQLLKQINHAFFKLIDTPEQPSLQLG
jgi:hypothetical protein